MSEQINIDDLTYAQLKEIARIFNHETANKSEEITCMKGQYVLCRCYSAGVHAGYLESQKGDIAILKNSRRLWSWGSNGGVALSGVAQLGLSPEKKIDVVNPLIVLTGVVETILCSKTAEKSINEY